MRASGILLPVSSLPSAYGIGAFDEKAYEFVDVLKRAGQAYWQILPLGPTSCGDSPYQSFSTFAGNPYFISLKELISQGLLTKEECDEVNFGGHPEYVDYEKMYFGRFPLLRKAYQRSNILEQQDFHIFIQENADWLPDYGLFMAIKGENEGKGFVEWEEDIKTRQPEAMERYRIELADEITFYMYLQYEFEKQWNRLKEYANQQGIKIIGDIPIYVAFDSADSWASRELFQFTEDCTPIAVAGCPPDGFSAEGQLWGNPVYQWEQHKKTEYEWWVRRVRHCFTRYDVVRIDHFRGFDEYYAIPYGEKTAVYGRWEHGPGIELFQTLKERLGKLNIIAEDLGFLTDNVRLLLAETKFPGMKVLQFAFDSREESDYMPHKYDNNCVVYTGTHDNETTADWFRHLPEQDKNVALRYMNLVGEEDPVKLTWHLVCLALRSVSDLAIIPAQDYLCLGNEARINTPATYGENWKWRMKEDAFSEELCEKIYSFTKLYGRTRD